MPRKKAIAIGRSDRFTSDTHFGHQLMIAKLEQPDGSVQQFRRFESIEAHDDDLIARWNRNTGPTDVTYHLGDFAGPRVSATRKREIFERLKGGKFILPGNHDDEGTLGLPWDGVLFGPQHFRDGNGQAVVALHWPLAEWDGWHNGARHIHGHTHGNRVSSRRRFDVGIDNAGSYPLTWSEIKDRMDHLPELDFNGNLMEPWKPDRGYSEPVNEFKQP
jgi:calcineurin-like phosphoesterase family protein